MLSMRNQGCGTKHVSAAERTTSQLTYYFYLSYDQGALTAHCPTTTYTNLRVHHHQPCDDAENTRRFNMIEYM